MEIFGPIEGLQAENRLHLLEVGIAVNQCDTMLHCNCGNKTICSRGRYPVPPEAPGEVPRCVPPIRAERESRHRGKPLKETGGLLGLDQPRHEFKKHPLCDGCLSIDDQGFESGLDLGIPCRTKSVDPDRGVNEIHGKAVYAAGNGAGQASNQEESCPRHQPAFVTGCAV